MALVSCAENRSQSLCLNAAGEFTQILQQRPGMSWRKLLIRELLLLEEGHEMQQVEAVSRQRVRGVVTSAQMPHEARDDFDRLTCVIEELKGHFSGCLKQNTLDFHRSLAPFVCTSILVTNRCFTGLQVST